MKYRPNREFLDQALKEVVEVNGREGLLQHLSEKIGYALSDKDLELHSQGFDKRCGWDSYLVCIKNVKINGRRYFDSKHFDGGPEYFGAVGHSDGDGR